MIKGVQGKRQLRELASEHGVEIPEDLDSSGSSGGYEEPDEDDVVRLLLSEHSEEEPLEPGDFEELTTDELLTAGDLLEDRGIGSKRYDPTAAAPIARILAEQGETERAVLLLENVIAEHDLIHWRLGGGRSRFVILADALIDLCGEDALEHVLTAWRRGRLDTMGYQGVIPQLVWIVKRTEGQIAAEELFSHTMDWMRRLTWPYEDRVQKWGTLEPTFYRDI